MTTSYVFASGYTKGGIATAPSVAPTVTIVDSNNNVLVAGATATTALSNLIGVYLYSYSGADNLVCFAFFHTTDTSMDQQDLASYTPSQIYSNSVTLGTINSNVGTAGAGLTALGDTRLANLNAPIGSIPTNPYTGTPPTASTIAGAVLDEAKGTHAGLIATALPAFAPDAAGGLPTVATGGLKLNKTVDLTAGQSIAVSDKTGFSLSVAGILAIWNQLVADAGIVSASFGVKLKNWVYGTDYKALVSTDTQDVSATLSVNAKLLGGASPNNLAAGAQMDLIDSLKNKSGSSGYDRTTDSLEGLGDKTSGGLLGADGKALISSDAQDLSATLHVDAKLLNNAIPNNLAIGSKMDLNDDLKNIAGSSGYNRTTDSLEGLGNSQFVVPILGTDGKVVISADAQDLSGTLSVNAKKLNGATPENLSASTVWNNTTRTLTQIQTIVETVPTLSDTTINIYNDVSVHIDMAELGDLSGYSNIFFTAKYNPTLPDINSALQIDTAHGLVYLHGVTTPTASDGTITVNNSTIGNITITLKPASSGFLLATTTPIYWDVKKISSSGAVVMTSGTINILQTVTRAVT